MKVGVIIAAILSVALGLGIVLYVGAGAVLAALTRIGWGGFSILILCQAALFPILGVAWFVLSSGEPARRLGAFIWGRMVRDAGVEVLPFSPVGGLVIGARAAHVAGVPAALAVGSTIVDVTTELLAQTVYAAFGLWLLLGRGGASASIPGLWGALILAMAIAGGFLLFQQKGLGFILRQIEARWPNGALAQADAVHAAIVGIYAKPLRVTLGVLIHIVAWVAAAAGVWVGLRLLGHPLGVREVLALESLLYAVRNLAFVSPAGLGVQEGAYVLLGGLFGLPPEVALALSLLKRARDLAIGAPTLLAWQAIEARRLVIGAKAPPAGG